MGRKTKLSRRDIMWALVHARFPSLPKAVFRALDKLNRRRRKNDIVPPVGLSLSSQEDAAVRVVISRAESIFKTMSEMLQNSQWGDGTSINLEGATCGTVKKVIERACHEALLGKDREVYRRTLWGLFEREFFQVAEAPQPNSRTGRHAVVPLAVGRDAAIKFFGLTRVHARTAKVLKPGLKQELVASMLGCKLDAFRARLQKIVNTMEKRKNGLPQALPRGTRLAAKSPVANNFRPRIPGDCVQTICNWLEDAQKAL